MDDIYIMPIGSDVAVLHMNNTLIGKVDKKTIEEHGVHLKDELYEDGKINVWGLVPGKTNKSNWSKFKPGTLVVFVAKDKLIVTRVVDTTQNADLARFLWSVDEKGRTWELIFFVKVLKFLNKDKKSFLSELGYSENFSLRGNTRVTGKHLELLEQFLKENEENEISGEELMDETAIEAIDSVEKLSKNKEERLKQLEELVQKALQNDKTEYVELHGRRIKRKQILVAFVKERDHYKCRACGFSFKTKDGEYYVEVAHINPLGKGGPDNPANMVALCPNCHKKLDRGDSEARKEVIEALRRNGVNIPEETD